MKQILELIVYLKSDEIVKIIYLYENSRNKI